MNVKRFGALASLTLASVAGASFAQLPAVPPYQGVYEPQGVDERGAWMEADENERRVRDSNLVIRDTAINDYVRSILCRTVGDDRCRNIRLYILRVPVLNASMAPNGTMIVWSGLLLRCRSEAELASILGHEFAHFERRHTLQRFRARRTASDIVAWTAVLGALANVPTSADIVMYGALARFSRDQEREADLLGLGYLSRSAYRPQAASALWDRAMDEADASALGRLQPSRRYERTAFFSSHPTDAERAGYLGQLAGPELDGRSDNAAAYAAAMRPWLPSFLEDQVRLNDFGGTEFILAELARDGWTADLLFARGELYRMRGNPRDLVNAADFYLQAVALDESRAESFRGLGLSLMRSGSTEEGRTALTRYLTLRPDAPDAPMIRALIGT